MNDRYKFRGKRIDNGEWVYGNLIYSSDACKEYETLIIPQRDADGFTTDYASNGMNKESYGFDNWFCVIPETIGQYTGFKDKNGKEIFEGDIIRVSCTYNSDVGDFFITNIAYDLCWNNGFSAEPIRGHSCITHIAEKDLSNVEVIGNIHDNHELLEVL